MPSRWWVPLQGLPGRVSVEHLHAAVSRWMDSDQDHWAGAKPWATSQVLTSPQLGGDGFLISSLTPMAQARVVAATRPGATIRLGRLTHRIGEPQLLDDVAWWRLADGDPRRVWDFRILTPATFMNGNRSSPWPDPDVVLKGLARTWDRWSGLPARPLPARGTLWVSGFRDLRSQRLRAGRAVVAGVVGSIQYRCDDPDAASDIDPLFRLAPFCGIGAKSTRGFGATELLPTVTSAPREGDHGETC